MKLTSPRFSKLSKTLRDKLILNAKNGNDNKALIYLARLNKVCTIQRARNLSNGMPGTPWVNVTLEQVKSDIVKKGL